MNNFLLNINNNFLEVYAYKRLKAFILKIFLKKKFIIINGVMYNLE